MSEFEPSHTTVFKSSLMTFLKHIAARGQRFSNAVSAPDVRPRFVYEAPGWCPICEKTVLFTARNDWFRDHLFCSDCGSIPRERALMIVLAQFYPNWRSLSIHESSPVWRGVSAKLHKECRSYVMSQYDRKIPFGSFDESGTYRSEDIENQTFNDECFDVVITQDVFEHLYRPDRAIKEISRTLRVGGAHIGTVPIVQKNAASRRRASLGVSGEFIHHLEPQYHSSALGDNGVLVTIDWGYDIARYLTEQSGLVTTLYLIDDLSRGVRAEFIEVVVNQKLPPIDGI